MSINDYVDTLEAAARIGLVKTKAIETCPLHPEVTIRVRDDDVERPHMLSRPHFSKATEQCGCGKISCPPLRDGGRRRVPPVRSPK
jgi:hypothetical protein